MAILVALIVSAAVCEELPGAPEPAPRLASAAPTGVVSHDWHRSLARLTPRSFVLSGVQPLIGAAEAARLFADSESGPRGLPAGLACEVTAPYRLDSVLLTTGGFPLAVLARGATVYLPEVVATPLRLVLVKNRAHGRDPLEETVLGIVTMGISSLIRLTPRVAATLTLPPGQRKAQTGAGSVECRVVGRRSVDAVAALRAPSQCSRIDCLGDEAALLGLARARERAQAIVDAQAALAWQWRRDATWTLRSVSIERVERCGAGCVRLSVRNTTQAPVDFPRVLRALDARGRNVVWVRDEARRLAPLATDTLTVQLQLEDAAGSPPEFPVVAEVQDRWHATVPGEIVVPGAVFHFAQPSGCDARPVVSLPMTQWLFDPAVLPDQVLFENGATSSVLRSSEQHDGLVSVSAEVRAPATCPAIVAISGNERTLAHLVIPAP